ncbi:MAG: hypothetical protein LC670_04130 [Flavobacteriales bacterium]|nr:hypothetical protein [Flavobacteriales bacterium]
MCAVFCTAVTINTASAQVSGFNERFNEALKLAEENELNMARSIWIELAKNNPDNGNVNYRAGLAQLNSGSNKIAALPYLKAAEEVGISRNYDRFSPMENKSPVELYYYLGIAYHLNYKFGQAEESFTKFLTTASRKHYLQDRADLGIAQARNAKELIKNRVDFEIVNLGPVINSEYPDFSPVISIDENALFFTSSRLRTDSSNEGVRDRTTGEYFNDIYVSYKDRRGEWQTPELLDINAPDHTATVNVSADGQTLYVYRDDNGVGNIYESKLVGETWTEMKIMGGGINSDHWEPHLAVSVDDQTAYFVSNRPGGLGGRDIYRVRRLPNGQWSKGENLGDKINTPYEEDAVFITPDGKTLYFSSEGHNSMGGFDVFYSDYDEGADEWSSPVNIGHPINTTDDDVFFVTSADGRRAYYSSIKETGYGEKDIYMVTLPGSREVTLALLTGKILAAEGAVIPSDIYVLVTNKETGESESYTPRSRDGAFVAILPPCYHYEVEYISRDVTLATDTFSIDCEIAYQEIYKELLLNPIRIETDGTATVLRSKEGEVIASASTPEFEPASFKRMFGYNEMDVAGEAQVFQAFMQRLNEIVEAKGHVNISIIASASKVPTRTYGSNEKLAELRMEDAVNRVNAAAKKMGINTEQLKFVKTESKVSGPQYKGDFRAGAETYQKFQYVEISAE